MERERERPRRRGVEPLGVVHCQQQWPWLCEIREHGGEGGAHRTRFEVAFAGVAAQGRDLERSSLRRRQVLKRFFWNRAEKIGQADVGQALIRWTRPA